MKRHHRKEQGLTENTSVTQLEKQVCLPKNEAGGSHFMDLEQPVQGKRASALLGTGS